MASDAWPMRDTTSAVPAASAVAAGSSAVIAPTLVSARVVAGVTTVTPTGYSGRTRTPQAGHTYVPSLCGFAPW